MKAFAESADVVLFGSLFHSGIVLATKWVLLTVVLQEGTRSLSLVARPLAALWFLASPSSSVGTATSSCRILYRSTSLAVRRLSSNGSSPREFSMVVTLAFSW